MNKDSSVMKAVRIHQYGGSEVLRYEEVPIPAPAPWEILLEVHASGVNPVDWKVREGYLRELVPHQLPLILGWDASGVVVAVGESVTDLRVGQLVIARPDPSRQGTYAQYVAVPATEVAIKPANVSHLEAASLPLAGLTAWKVVVETAAIRPGQRVLVHGAAGGVGSYAVQLAKWRGAFVIGTALSANVGYLTKVGADQVVDYSLTPFEQQVGKVDVVIDLVGGETLERSYRVVNKGGMIVSTVQPVNAATMQSLEINGHFIYAPPNRENLTRIAQLVEQGKLQPALQQVLPLAQAAKAQLILQRGLLPRGKLVLQVR